MTFTIPAWTVYVIAVALWLYVAYGSLLMRAIDGRDQHERLIVSLLIAGAWPFRFVGGAIVMLFRKPR